MRADYTFQISQQLDWQHNSFRIYGKEMPLPRLEIMFGDDGCTYRYSNVVLSPLPWIPELQALRERVEAATGCKYQVVIGNFYRTGADHIGWHSDDSPEMGTDPAIASISLGATRRFDVWHIRYPVRRVTKQVESFDLGHGDLIFMPPGFQSTHKHRIAKTSKPSDIRINWTFRPHINAMATATKPPTRDLQVGDRVSTSEGSKIGTITAKHGKKFEITWENKQVQQVTARQFQDFGWKKVELPSTAPELKEGDRVTWQKFPNATYEILKIGQLKAIINLIEECNPGSTLAPDQKSVPVGELRLAARVSSPSCDRCRHGDLKEAVEGKAVSCSMNHFTGAVMAGEIVAKAQAQSCNSFEAGEPQNDDDTTPDPRTIRGACVKVPSGDRAYVEGVDPTDHKRVRIKYEAVKFYGQDPFDTYPLHMLTLVHPSMEVEEVNTQESRIASQTPSRRRKSEFAEAYEAEAAAIVSSTPTEIIPSDPTERLQQLETDIQAGLDLVEQGKARIWQAAALIQQEELWKLGHSSFEDYCKRRWGWERSNAYEVASAGRVVNELRQSGIPDSDLPTSVSQTRELAKLPVEERPVALKAAIATTNGKPTAKAIREAAAELAPAAPSEYDYLPVEPEPVWFERFGQQIEGQIMARSPRGMVRIVYGEDQETNIPATSLLPNPAIKQQVEEFQQEQRENVVRIAIDQLGALKVALLALEACTEAEKQEVGKFLLDWS